MVVCADAARKRRECENVSLKSGVSCLSQPPRNKAFEIEMHGSCKNIKKRESMIHVMGTELQLTCTVLPHHDDVPNSGLIRQLPH